jgi:hypothetical protein
MRAWLIVSAVLLLAFAPAPLPRREKSKDHESRLLGNWRIRTIRWQGRDSYTSSSFASYVVSTNDLVVISRGRITFQADKGRSQGDRSSGVVISGPEGVRHIDFGEKGGQTFRGLYQLRGGVLYLSFCYTGDGPRPTQLTGDGNEIAFVLDRR